MKHDEIINIQKTIGHWANNCGGCETCEREFGGQEEPTFDMQTVYEICAAYAEAIKMLEEMAIALELVDCGECDCGVSFSMSCVSKALKKYREFKEGIK